MQNSIKKINKNGEFRIWRGIKNCGYCKAYALLDQKLLLCLKGLKLDREKQYFFVFNEVPCNRNIVTACL